jgi:accessory colonization factor AcfC
MLTPEEVTRKYKEKFGITKIMQEVWLENYVFNLHKSVQDTEQSDKKKCLEEKIELVRTEGASLAQTSEEDPGKWEEEQVRNNIEEPMQKFRDMLERLEPGDEIGIERETKNFHNRMTEEVRKIERELKMTPDDS